MTTRTYAQMTSAELRRESDTLAMLYDDECRSVWDDTNERYDQAALDSWDRRIDEIDAILAIRQRCPECGYNDVRVMGGGNLLAWYECQDCLVRFPLGDVAYDDTEVQP